MKHKMWFILLAIGVIFLLTGCDSDDGAKADGEPVDQTKGKEEESEHADVFEETDKIAMEFYKAGFELNLPVLYDFLSPKGQKTIDDYTVNLDLEATSDTLINPKEYKKYKESNPDQFNNFKDLHHEYEVKRFDEYYDENIGEVVYRVNPWKDKDGYDDTGDFNYIVMKQNEDGEWKVRALGDGKPDYITDGKTEGTIIHKYQKHEEAEDDSEDEYGF